MVEQAKSADITIRKAKLSAGWEERADGKISQMEEVRMKPSSNNVDTDGHKEG